MSATCHMSTLNNARAVFTSMGYISRALVAAVIYAALMTWPLTDVMWVGTLLVLVLSVYIVPANTLYVLSCPFTGKFRRATPGIHVYPPYLQRVDVESTCFAWFKRFPLPGGRVDIDPPPADAHTADGIPVTVDVSAECVVSDWKCATIMSDAGCTQKRTHTVINQWIAAQILSVESMQCTYGILCDLLNEKKKIDNLNRSLLNASTHMTVVRVILDPAGINLSSMHGKQRDAINLETQRLDGSKRVMELTTEKTQFDITMEQMRNDADIERRMKAADCEAHAISAAIAAGMTAEQYCRIAVARLHFETMASNSNTVYLGVPPGLLGMLPVTSPEPVVT